MRAVREYSLDFCITKIYNRTCSASYRYSNPSNLSKLEKTEKKAFLRSHSSKFYSIENIVDQLIRFFSLKYFTSKFTIEVEICETIHFMLYAQAEFHVLNLGLGLPPLCYQPHKVACCSSHPLNSIKQ